MNFASDNAAGIAPEIFAAIARANQGAALAYGRDPWTGRIEQRFAEIFERWIVESRRQSCRMHCPHDTILSFRNARDLVSAHPPRPRRRKAARRGRNSSS